MGWEPLRWRELNKISTWEVIYCEISTHALANAVAEYVGEGYHEEEPETSKTLDPNGKSFFRQLNEHSSTISPFANRS